MKASKLIKTLQDLIDTFGDCEAVDEWGMPLRVHFVPENAGVRQPAEIIITS